MEKVKDRKVALFYMASIANNRELLEKAIKHILEKISKVNLDKQSIYVGKGSFYSKWLIGDSDNPFSCKVCFEFGYSGHNGILFDKHTYCTTPRHCMVNMHELDDLDFWSVVDEMLYSGQYLTLIKNRYGLRGQTIKPMSIDDALHQVGISAEEFLIYNDLSL